MEFGLKGTSPVCRGHHGEVGIVEFGLYASHVCDNRVQYSGGLPIRLTRLHPRACKC